MAISRPSCTVIVIIILIVVVVAVVAVAPPDRIPAGCPRRCPWPPRTCPACPTTSQGCLSMSIVQSRGVGGRVGGRGGEVGREGKGAQQHRKVACQCQSSKAEA